MKYRKYIKKVSIGASIAILALGFMSCASTPRNPASETDTGQSTNEREYDGREPKTLRGEFTWLDEVGDNFNKVAAKTSNRAVASESKHEVLLKKKNWVFSYLPKTNHFYVDVQGTTYQMAQTQINDGERFAFAAEGQTDNPLTFSVKKGEGRGTASGSICDTEISYWNKKSKSYVTDNVNVKGKSCERLISLLKDYVP